MRIGIYSNPNRDKNFKSTLNLIDICNSRNIEWYVDYNVAKSLKVDNYFDNKTSLDFVVTLGGDGTILHYLRQTDNYDIPIVGINLGNIGYLSEADANELESVVNSLCNNDYRIDSRDLLQIVHNQNVYNALNEAVIAIGNEYKMLEFELYIDDIQVDTISSDGIVISTPTGSTAYCLSAGGPIVSPDIKAYIIAPICSHSLKSRPIIVADNHITKVKMTGNNVLTRLVIDGKQVSEISPNDEVEFLNSAISIKLVKLAKINFYNRLKYKLNK